MKIDLPIDSECLLPDGQMIEPVENRSGCCYGCVFVESRCPDIPFICCGDIRNDGLWVHFRVKANP